MPKDFDAIRVLILFLIPGFISQSIVAASIPRQRREANETILEAIVLSCINYAVFGLPLLVPSLYREFVEPRLWLTWVLWALVLFVAPVWWGFLFAWLLHTRAYTAVFRRFGVPYREPAPRAWDHYFSQQRQGWLRITCTDGSMIAGFMGARSFASSFPAAEDLYLEAVYHVDEGGVLAAGPVPESDGVWVQGSQIRSIEFLSLTEEVTRDGRETTATT